MTSGLSHMCAVVQPFKFSSVPTPSSSPPPVSSAALPPLSSSLLCAPTLFFACPLISSVPLFVFPHIYTSCHGLRCIVLPSRACLRWWWKQARHKVDTVDPWVPRWTRFSVPNFKYHVGGWSKREKEWFPASPEEIPELPAHELPSINPCPCHSFFSLAFLFKAFSSLHLGIVSSLPHLHHCVHHLPEQNQEKLTPGLRRSRGLRKPQVGRGFAPGWFELAASVVK